MKNYKVFFTILFCLIGIITMMVLISKTNQPPDTDEKLPSETVNSVQDVLNAMEETVKKNSITDGILFKEGFTKGVNISADELYIADEAYFKQIKDKGFDFVRLDASYYGDDLLYNRINLALQNELGVVIAPVFAAYKTQSEWERFAEKYKDLPSNVVFEILKDSGTTDINALNKTCINAVRKYDAARKIIIHPPVFYIYDWASYYLQQLQVPSNDKNLIIGFDYFNPVTFTRQGTKEYYPPGEKWMGDELECTVIEQAFNEIKAVSKACGLSVMLTSFGSAESSDAESRMRWTKYVRECAETYGFAWCYQEFDETFTDLLTSGVYSSGYGKNDAKVTAEWLKGTDEPPYFTFGRKMTIYTMGGFVLYDADSKTQRADIRNAEDDTYLLMPINIYNDSKTVKKNNVEFTVKTQGITDLRIGIINISSGGGLDIVTPPLLDAYGESFDETLAQYGQSDYSGRITLKFNISEYSECDSNGIMYLALYPETVAERKDSYDRKGTVEFIELIVY